MMSWRPLAHGSAEGHLVTELLHRCDVNLDARGCRSMTGARAQADLRLLPMKVPLAVLCVSISIESMWPGLLLDAEWARTREWRGLHSLVEQRPGAVQPVGRRPASMITVA
jgi:hypothetical protein